MIFRAELTLSGCLVSWSGPLNQGESISFKSGRSDDSMVERFTAAESPGSEAFSLAEDADAAIPNLSARLDVVDGGAVVRTSGVRPLVPGLSAKDVRLLYKLASDHTRSAVLRGLTAQMYRQRTGSVPCTNCCHPVTGVQLVSECDVCGGSGTVDGWLGPFSVKVLMMQHMMSEIAPAGGGGLQQTSVETVRLSAFPRPRADDRLFVPDSRMVYLLGTPQRTVAGVAGVPAVVEMQVRLPDPDSKEATIPESW